MLTSPRCSRSALRPSAGDAGPAPASSIRLQASGFRRDGFVNNTRGRSRALGMTRASSVILRVFCALAAFALGSGACGRHLQANTRAIVLGFDGLDYDLTRTLMEAGRLSNFSRLARQGRFSELGSTMPPQSPVAWSSFTTGLAPDQHGIFDF